MIDELKKIKIAEIDEELSKLKSVKPKVIEFSWLEKNITKKREYREYLLDLELQKEQLAQKISKLEELKEKYEKATVPGTLGLTLEEAIILLKEHNITPILTEKDLNTTLYLTKPDIDELGGLILVHKSGHLPENGMIKTIKDADAFFEFTEAIGDREIHIKQHKTRDTVHFSVNGEVSSHFLGNWDDKKYAVLIPFKDIPSGQIANAAPEDTYTRGSVTLTPNSWILVPKGEGDQVKRDNPRVNVIEYEGPSVTRFADQLVRLLGYNQEQITNNDWCNSEDSKRYKNLMKNLGYRLSSHEGSMEEYQEEFYKRLSLIIKYLDLVINEPILLEDTNFVYALKEKIKDSFTSIRIPSVLYDRHDIIAHQICAYLKEYNISIDENKAVKSISGSILHLYSDISDQIIESLKENLAAKDKTLKIL